MMDSTQQERLRNIFASQKGVIVAYLFGSQARGDAGPLSDWDFAVSLDPSLSANEQWEIRMNLEKNVSKLLAIEAVDIVVLNDLDKPEMAYHIITDGKILYEQESYCATIEPRILSEYFDFRDMLRRHGLTKA